MVLESLRGRYAPLGYIHLLRYGILAAAFILGVFTLTTQFSRRARITHCPSKLEASGVHELLNGPGSQHENFLRKALYDSMHHSFVTDGLKLEQSLTQGMSMNDMFQVKSGMLVPRLTPLDIPVRAIVAPITDAVASKKIAESLEKHVLSITTPTELWPQNSELYHITVWHASPHQHPVQADKKQQDEEVRAIQSVMLSLCPIHMTLERIIINSAGVIMACWQISHGTTASQLRQSLQKALPRAPDPSKQTVRNETVWYTTLGRMLVKPKRLGQRSGGAAAAALDMIAQDMTEDLCGMQTVVDRVWYVREYEKLALALGGRWDLEEAVMSDQEGACTFS